MSEQDKTPLSVGTLDERAVRLFGLRPNPDARNDLVQMYYPLIEYLARRFRGRGEPLDDLIQVASVGLLKAIDRFELGRGIKFSTYAVPTIIGELRRHFRDTGWTVRIPRRLQENALLLRSVVPDLSQELGRSPTIAEIGARAGLTEDEVLDAMEATHAYSVGSLDTPAGESEGRTVADTLGDEDERLEILEGWTQVAPLLRDLPERERHLLYLRFVRGLAQGEIAQRLGVSQMHVSRLLSKTLRDLRAAAQRSQDR